MFKSLSLDMKLTILIIVACILGVTYLTGYTVGKQTVRTEIAAQTAQVSNDLTVGISESGQREADNAVKFEKGIGETDKLADTVQKEIDSYASSKKKPVSNKPAGRHQPNPSEGTVEVADPVPDPDSISDPDFVRLWNLQTRIGDVTRTGTPSPAQPVPEDPLRGNECHSNLGLKCPTAVAGLGLRSGRPEVEDPLHTE